MGFLVWLGFILFAHQQTRLRLNNRDPYLLPIAALLSGLGLMNIWRLYPDLGLRQTFWLGFAGIIFIAGLRLPTDLGFLRRYKYLWLSAGLLLTALTLVFGTNPLGYGPRLWLWCCGFFFQPSEPLKLLLIVYLSAYLADRLFTSLDTGSPLLPMLAPTLLMTGLAMGLLLVQRDLGTASIFLFLYTAIVYLTTKRIGILLSGGLSLLLAGLAGYALFDVVRVRVNAWLNPWLDPSGGSYQVVQSLLAVANGGFIGRGPGLGNPSLVPVAHSDFIFSAIAEELGLAGVLAMCILMALFLNRGLRAALRAPDAYRRILAASLTTHIVAQSILISGGNLRLLPLTGVTYPFVSYGGSSLLTSFLSLLILLHISNHAEDNPARSVARARPYLQLGGFLLLGISAVALTSGWWAAVRGPTLLGRTDNPRRAVADSFVSRGRLLDRSSEPIAVTSGNSGSYVREILYPALSPVIGYTNRVYGQSGLEASLDDYLRGLKGNPNSTIWWNHLLYGQPPPGLDIRLSLDLRLQKIADQALAGQTGALVLLDAHSGEVLAMATSPSFDANQLETSWEELVGDANAPLLNRAAQGRYPAELMLSSLFPETDTFEQELLAAPQIYLPVNEPVDAGQPRYSPLQIALGTAAICAKGVVPAARLVLAVNTPQAGWVLLPSLEKPRQIIPAEATSKVVNRLAIPGQITWHSVVVEKNQPDQGISWFAGGTTPAWEGVPLAIAVVLEVENPILVKDIGEAVLQAAMLP